jgi:flagellar biosynthesis/type III secretory pathway protein FliH
VRTRYEPPTVDAPPAAAASVTPANAIFGRPLAGELVPWVLGQVAANSAPEPRGPSEDELARIYAQAREAGLTEGRAAAAEELAQLEAQLVDKARATIEELARVRTLLIEQTRAELLELAVVIAESVMQREIEGGRPTVEPLLAQALLELDPHERCTISVATDELSWAVQWAAASWPAALVRADPSLARGELRIDATRGRIEIDRAQRIDRVRRMLQGGAA